MAQLFKPGANSIAVSCIVALFVLPVIAIGVTYLVWNSPYATNQLLTREQPVPFSHAHHVGDLGLDCRMCHTGVEKAAFAGLPSTHICMTCHSQLWTKAAMLAPVRDSLATGQPIHWRRVNRVPDYVFFDHNIHVAKGVGCSTCHGPVQAMALMRAGTADDGVVPAMPPSSGTLCPPLRPCLRHGLAATRGPGDSGRSARARVSHRRRPVDRLFDMSPLREQLEIDRRLALKLIAASAAVTMTRCSPPDDEIIPYTEMPEGMVAGEPMRFATSLSLSGYGRGFIVTSVDGRPIKIEGNPRHPYSLGATDVFAEARNTLPLRPWTVHGRPPRGADLNLGRFCCGVGTSRRLACRCDNRVGHRTRRIADDLGAYRGL